MGFIERAVNHAINTCIKGAHDINGYNGTHRGIGLDFGSRKLWVSNLETLLEKGGHKDHRGGIISRNRVVFSYKGACMLSLTSKYISRFE